MSLVQLKQGASFRRQLYYENKHWRIDLWCTKSPVLDIKSFLQSHCFKSTAYEWKTVLYRRNSSDFFVFLFPKSPKKRWDCTRKLPEFFRVIYKYMFSIKIKYLFIFYYYFFFFKTCTYKIYIIGLIFTKLCCLSILTDYVTN